MMYNKQDCLLPRYDTIGNGKFMLLLIARRFRASVGESMGPARHKASEVALKVVSDFSPLLQYVTLIGTTNH